MQNNYYHSTDFCLVSFLLLCNINPDYINKDNTGKVTFSFLKNSQVESLVEQFSTLKAKVEPLSFFSAQKKLKQLIYLNS